MNALHFKNLTAGYDRKPVIQGLNGEAQSGQFIVLLGPNGCGKSTLLKSLAGIRPIQSGHIDVEGGDISALPRRAIAAKIAYLAQQRDMVWPLSVRDVIALGRAPYRGPLGRISAEGQAKINDVIERLDLNAFAHRSILDLSGGEQARVLLARALVVDAPILLADEPFASLDPAAQIHMTEILKHEAQSGKTVISAIHDLALAQHYADEIWLMKDGLFIAKGAPANVLTDENLVQAFGIHPPKGGFSLPRVVAS